MEDMRNYYIFVSINITLKVELSKPLEILIILTYL